MILTHELLEAGRDAAGEFNLHQLRALTLRRPLNGWPPANSDVWPEWLIGREVTEEQYAEFLSKRTLVQPRPYDKAEDDAMLEQVCSTCGGRSEIFHLGYGQYEPCPDCRSTAPEQEAAHEPVDRNVESVKAKMDARAKAGRAKDGFTIEPKRSLLDWLRAEQEEAMDYAIYLEPEIRKEEERIATSTQSD